MKCNVGTIDRIVRVLLGLVLIGLGIYFSSWWGAIGLIPLATAAVSWCPLYRLVGLTTCRVRA
jgi:predicted transporter